VALVWLVLQVTGSGLELGTVLVVAAIPRAVAMLISGTVIDRVSPRRALLAAGCLSALLVGAVAALLSLNWLGILLLMLIAALQGLMDAFFYPAAMAMLPRLVDKSQLTAANGLFTTSDSVANILGPALSGFVIGAVGLIWGFVANAGLFLLGTLLIWCIRERRAVQPVDTPLVASESFGAALLNGFRFALDNIVIRTMLLMVAALNLAALGPTIVGGAALVERRFGGDATMYGFFVAAYGVGALLGGLGAGFLPPARRPGLLLAWLSVGMGVGLALLGIAPSFWVAFAIQATMGVGVGVVGVVAISWLQRRTPDTMQGRMASLLVFAAVALDPFSNAISGAMLDVSLTWLYLGAGSFMLLVAGAVWLSGVTRLESDE
ncbi:MAG: MFS transporter, partial [Chloroflexaceae bacterium]|nr:MFS transporter [Chloroflexaceae bacterium]